jgi:hypothetical protein
MNFEKDLQKEFMCVVCFFAEFVVFENVDSDYEFCDSILIFFRFFAFYFVAFFIISSILKNSIKKNQSSFISFSSMKKRKSEIKEKLVFISCFSVCFSVNSSIENLFAFIFSIFEINFLILFVWSLFVFLNLKKYKIIQKKEKKFLNVKIVTKNNVSNLCETKSSNFLSLNKFCVEVIEIEKKEKKLLFVSSFLRSILS